MSGPRAKREAETHLHLAGRVVFGKGPPVAHARLRGKRAGQGADAPDHDFAQRHGTEHAVPRAEHLGVERAIGHEGRGASHRIEPGDLAGAHLLDRSKHLGLRAGQEAVFVAGKGRGIGDVVEQHLGR